MKLFGKFNEMSINQIFLYNAPEMKIEEIMAKYPSTEVIVKERKSRPIYRTNEDGQGNKEVFKIDQDPSKRHKVILKQDLGFMKVEIHSYGLNAEQIKKLKLEPIPEVTKKERAGQAVQKMKEWNPMPSGMTKVVKKNGKYVEAK
jgi:hypothetical protein